MSFSPDGKWLASGEGGLVNHLAGDERLTVRVWDAADGPTAAAIGRSWRQRLVVDFQPEWEVPGQWLVDNTVRVWDAGTALRKKKLISHVDNGAC